MVSLRDIIPEIQKFAEMKMLKDILHGWPHVNRVLKYASIINEEVKANWDIIHCAVLLHDIGHQVNRDNHNTISADMAGKFLKNQEIDTEVVKAIKHCILTHSRQFASEKPASSEARVVYDADGMDLFGPIGLMRGLLSCGLRNKGFDCMLKKMKWRLDQVKAFYSNVGRKFVAQNSKIIMDYMKELENQIEKLK